LETEDGSISLTEVLMRLSTLVIVAGAALSTIGAGLLAQQAAPTEADGPYKVIKSARVGGEGGFDYVFADSDSRKLFIVRSGRPGGRCDVYDLDDVKLIGSIPNVNGGHGVAVDTKTGHGFTSSNPIVMFDTKTLETIKTIPVTGGPDGIFFEPSTEHIFVLSHRDPNVTVLNGVDGAIVGTIDLGGAPEEGASDGKGHVYIDIEDKDMVAVVDPVANKVIGDYQLNGKGGGPGGLALDAKNGIIFSFCADPQTCVIMNAADGKILDALPIGNGVDAAEFNPDTLEAFSSQRDGTLTIIKETSPTTFVVEQTVKTPRGAKCSTLDAKTGQIYLTSAERAGPSTQPARAGAATQPTAGGGRRGGGGRGGPTVPGSFTITVVGKE
jgi:DNA-binding beta-propeller fold protein YncE